MDSIVNPLAFEVAGSRTIVRHTDPTFGGATTAARLALFAVAGVHVYRSIPRFINTETKVMVDGKRDLCQGPPSAKFDPVYERSFA
jgi:hypothetical protein